MPKFLAFLFPSHRRRKMQFALDVQAVLKEVAMLRDNAPGCGVRHATRALNRLERNLGREVV